jgi:hypothetical protein
VQAQDEAAAGLAMRARGRGVVAEDVRAALIDTRSLVLTWSLRGTRHIHRADAPADLARWSGLSPTVARRSWGAIAGELAEVTSEEGPSWVLKRRARGVGKAAREHGSVRLVGAFDPLLLGYAHRDLFVTPRRSRKVNARGGVIKPTVLVDARVAGTWKLVGRAGSRRPQVDLFDDVGPGIAQGIEEEVRDVERFSG